MHVVLTDVLLEQVLHVTVPHCMTQFHFRLPEVTIYVRQELHSAAPRETIASQAARMLTRELKIAKIIHA